MSTYTEHTPQPLDYAHVYVMTGISLLSLAAYFKAYHARHDYPPFQAKQLGNVGASLTGGLLWCGFGSTYLLLGYHATPFLQQDGWCGILSMASSLGLSLYQGSVTTRLYRWHSIFIRRNPHMWSPWAQASWFVLYYSVGLSITYIAYPYVWVNGSCAPTLPPEIQGVLSMSILMISMVWCFINVIFFVRIRRIRLQYNEFWPSVSDAVAYIGGWSAYMIDELDLLGDEVLERNLAFFVFWQAPIGKFWTSMGIPLWHYFNGNDRYCQDFVIGLNSPPNELLQRPVSDMLESPKLRAVILQFAVKRHTVEHVDFWLDAKARKQLSEFDEVLAATLTIRDKYLATNCPYPINISDKLRERLLAATEVVKESYLDEAMEEVLFLLENDLRPALENDNSFQQMVGEFELERAELDILRQARALPSVRPGSLYSASHSAEVQSTSSWTSAQNHTVPSGKRSFGARIMRSGRLMKRSPGRRTDAGDDDADKDQLDENLVDCSEQGGVREDEITPPDAHQLSPRASLRQEPHLPGTADDASS